MVGLIEVLFDVVVIISNFGPDVYVFPNAKNAFSGGPEAFAQIMVYGTRDTEIERTRTFLAYS